MLAIIFKKITHFFMACNSLPCHLLFVT